MISGRAKMQLIAFLIISVVGISYVGVRYFNLASAFGGGGYTVRLQLTDSGGIFTNAEVTYRGVTVGRVGPLQLTRQGVEADLEIERGAPPIPADLDAVVANRSAVGEQYVDLRPVRPGGPPLQEGSVIPASRTTTPVPVETLLLDIDELARSVPLDSLRTVVTELGAAFAGTGPQLQTLLDSSQTLTDSAVDALPPTLDLIRDGRTVLQTQNVQSSAITSFSRDLALFAEQLRTSDPDLRRLITTTPQVSIQVIQLLRESGTQIGRLIADLLTVSRIAGPRLDGLEQILVTYPFEAARAYTVTPGDGWAHFGLVLNVNDPPPCEQGYQGTERRSGIETEPVPLNTDARCTLPRGDQSSVRGAQNVPRPGTGVPAPVPAPGPSPASGTSSTTTPPWSGSGSGPYQEPMTDLAGVLR